MNRYKFAILDPNVSVREGTEYRHKACGEMLSARRVSLSNRIGGIPLAGSGQVEVTIIPYCQTCDVPPPPDHGTYMDDGTINHPSFRLVIESATVEG